MNAPEELLKITDLRVHFPVRGGIFRRAVGSCKAVDQVSLVLQKGQTLGLVGESGCGKSTLAKAVVKLVEPTSGSIKFKNQEIAGKKAQNNFRKNVQMVFQDPAESLNSRMTVGAILEEPLDIHNIVEKMFVLKGWGSYLNRLAYLQAQQIDIRLNFRADRGRELESPVLWLCSPNF